MEWPILVGGLVAIFYFPINIGCLIIPIDELIFFRGVTQPPTRIRYHIWRKWNIIKHPWPSINKLFFRYPRGTRVWRKAIWVNRSTFQEVDTAWQLGWPIPGSGFFLCWGTPRLHHTDHVQLGFRMLSLEIPENGQYINIPTSFDEIIVRHWSVVVGSTMWAPPSWRTIDSAGISWYIYQKPSFRNIDNAHL